MKGTRYSEEKILAILKEIDSGSSIASVARTHGVTAPTLYRWKEQYAGMSKSELAELKRIQEENKRLKRVVARQALEIEAYKEVAEGNW